MLTVISPAKTLDFDTIPGTRRATRPQFLDRAQGLVEDMRRLDPDDIRGLMGVSENIARLNHRRFMNFQTPFTLDNAKQSLLAFQGDVYTGLQAHSMDSGQLAFAQQHLRILSGLYGLLRPLDLMQPYRLEMGLKFANRGGANLYEFWGDDITRALNAQLRKTGSEVLVNLASNEYFKAVRSARLEAEVVTPVFKDLKNGKYKVLSFYAKTARGQMARFIIDREIQDVAGLRKFRVAGYRYNRVQSGPGQLVFTRDQAPLPASLQTASLQTASKQTASKQTASKQTASKQTASKQTASKQTASKQTASRQTASRQTASRQTASRQTASRQTASRQTASRQTTRRAGAAATAPASNRPGAAPGRPAPRPPGA